MEDNTGNSGNTEVRIEKVARWVMGKHFRALGVVSQDVNSLETCLVLSMVKIYTNWCMSKGGRYDNSQFVNLLVGRINALNRATLGKTDEEMAKLFQNMAVSRGSDDDL